MFGAVGAPAAPPTEAPKAAVPTSTMMFGAVGAPGAPAPAAPVPNTTMMFGAVGGAQAPAKGPQLTAATAAPVNAPAGHTMMFGAVPAGGSAPAPAPTTRGATQTAMFGVPQAGDAAQQPMPKVTMGAAEVAGQAAVERIESTVRIDANTLLAGQGGPSAARHNQTQLFAMDAAQPAPKGVPAHHNRTAIFAMSTMDRPSSDARVAPSPDSPPSVVVEAEVAPAPAPTAPMPAAGQGGYKATMMFAGQAQPPAPAPAMEPIGNVEEPTALVSSQDSVTLPPEPAHLGLNREATSDSGDGDAAAIMAASKRRASLALAVIGLLVLLGVLFVAFKALGPRLLGSGESAEMRGQVAAALFKLRLDDAISKKETIDALRALVTKSPSFVDAHAGLVLALAVDFDDVQQRAVRLQKKYEALKKRLDAAKAEGSRAAGVEILAGRINELTEKHQALLPSANAAREQLQSAANAMQALAPSVETGSEGELAVVRASAVLKGVIGEADAIGLAERARVMSKEPEPWAELAQAEYAANATSGSRPEAIAALKALLENAQGGTLIRAYVLMARLHLLEGNYTDAIGELEKVTSMRSDHEVATELLAWAKKEAAEQK